MRKSAGKPHTLRRPYRYFHLRHLIVNFGKTVNIATPVKSSFFIRNILGSSLTFLLVVIHDLPFQIRF